MSTKMDFTLSPAAVAKRIGCSRKHVYELLAEGSLHGIDIRTKGNKPRFRISESSLVMFIETRRVREI